MCTNIKLIAQIKVNYLPSSWKKVVKRANEVSENKICRVEPEDFEVNDGLKAMLEIGNGCYDDIVAQFNEIAYHLGGTLRLKSQCL